MTLDIPPQIAAALSQAVQQPPTGLQGGGPERDYPHDPLAAVQECINDLHAAMPAFHDPQDTMDITNALRLLMGIQKRLMQPQQGGNGPQPQG